VKFCIFERISFERPCYLRPKIVHYSALSSPAALALLNRKTRKLTTFFLGMEVSSLRHGGMSLSFSLSVLRETFEICSGLYGKPTQTAPVSLSPAWNCSWPVNVHHHSFYVIAIMQPRTLLVPGQAG